MNVEDFIKAMPKAEIGIRLEGCFRKETMLTIAEQNEIAASTKHFQDWVKLLHEPDHKRAEEIVKTIGQWIRYPDDLTHLVYDLGVNLAKQNVKYAEVLVNPSIHMLGGVSFEVFMEALNDGRDRVRRAWGVNLVWVLTVSREEPRRADEISRWAASVTGRKAGVVGFALIGPEDVQPVGQFQRAFQNSRKKEIPTMAQAGNMAGADGVSETLQELEPDRLMSGWGIDQSEALLQKLSTQQTPLLISIQAAVASGWIDKAEEYPLKNLYDENIKLVITSEMPSIYGTSLNTEYQLAVEKCGMSFTELTEIALNAVECSFLPADQKSEMLEAFRETYAGLISDAMTSEAN